MIQVQRVFLSIRLYKEHFWDLYFSPKKSGTDDGDDESKDYSTFH